MIVVVTVLLACGLFFFLGGAVGIIRFPDFYSLLHPAGKLDTIGLLTTMTAMALYTDRFVCRLADSCMPQLPGANHRQDSQVQDYASHE